MIRRQAEAVTLVLPVQPQFHVAAFFRLQARLAVFRKTLIKRRHAKRRASRCRYAPVWRKSKAIGRTARGFAAKFTVAVVAHIHLHRVRAVAVAIAQRHGVLITILFAVRNRGVGQFVFAALKCSGKGMVALLPFVLQQVVAQLGFRQIGRGLRFVFLPRFIDRQTRAPYRRPLG